MIPKIIHYIWLGNNPLPQLVKDNNKVISSDWEVKIWTDKDFTFEECQWVKEAKSLNLYMYCSDALRFYIIKKYGGIYLDVDVQLYKLPYNLLHLPYVIGNDQHNMVNSANSGILLAEPNNNVMNELWEYYKSTFLIKNGYYLQVNDVDRLRMWLRNKSVYTANSVDEYTNNINKYDICLFHQNGWHIYNPNLDYSFFSHFHQKTWKNSFKRHNYFIKI